MKTKDFALEIKSADEDGTFEGYGSVFGGPPDSYNEIVDPGAFSDSLAKHRRSGTMPMMFWQHDPSSPIGVWKDLVEDGKGLWGKGQLLKGIRQADETHILLKAGAIRGLSIGYREEEAQPDGAVRRLKKLDLIEVSVVSIPANSRARVDVSSVKAERWADLGEGWSDLARKVRDGEPPPTKDFEALLREAGVPKSMAVAIASVGYGKAIRSDSEGGGAKNDNATAVLAALRDAVGAFHP